jgi:tRNA(Glu) U13 pseudouridine synthase TruD
MTGAAYPGPWITATTPRTQATPMRIKRIPEDFRVREILRPGVLARQGLPVYEVRKVRQDGLLLPGLVARILGVAPRDVQVPAVKDRQAVTYQHVAVRSLHPLPEAFEGEGFQGRLVGRTASSLRASAIFANRFRIRITEISPAAAGPLRRNLQAIGRMGTLNLFDRQRFLSHCPGLGYPGKLLLERRHTDVLRAYLLVPAIGDPPEVRSFKLRAQELYPDYPAIAAAAGRSNQRSVLSFLAVHPEDHRHAVGLITPAILSMWLAAYQSDLWNRTLARVIQKRGSAMRSLPGPTGPMPAPDPGTSARSLGFAMDATLPLFHHRTTIADPRLEEAADEILAEEGLTWHDLKPRGLEVAWMGRAERLVWVVPEGLRVGPPFEDPGAAGLLTLDVEMQLPAGSYATWILRVAAPPGEPFHAGPWDQEESGDAALADSGDAHMDADLEDGGEGGSGDHA